MSDMAHTSQPERHPYTASWAVWSILIGCGGVEVAFNIYHAVHGGLLQPVLGTLLGIAPVYAAVLLAHVVAANDSSKGVRTVLFAVMAGAMGVSIGAIAVTVAPVAAGGIYGGVLFGLVLDGACLTALWVITSKHQQKAAEAAELEAALAAVSAATDSARNAAAEATELRQKLAGVQAELATATGQVQGLGSAAVRADEISAEAGQLRDHLTEARALLATAQGEVSGLRDASARADQATVEAAELRTELAATKAVLEAERNRAPRRTRKRNSGGGTQRPSTARNNDAGGGTDDANIEAAALAELHANPDVTGADLGRKLGVTESYGRRLKRELASSVTDPEG